MSLFFKSTVALTKREIVRFLRQRSRVIGSLATPLMFWFVIGGGFKNSFVDPSKMTASYFEYFFPGTLVLSVLFTAIFSTISVIEDRHQGFLQGVLVSPAPRGAIVLSKTLGGALLGIFQVILLLILSPLAGLHLGFEQIILSLFLLFVMGGLLTLIGFFFAWKIDSVQGYHGIMNIVLFPMWLLSGAVFPLSGSSVVFQWVSRINPLTYSVESLREVFLTNVYPHFASTLVILLVGTLALYAFNVALVRKAAS